MNIVRRPIRLFLVSLVVWSLAILPQFAAAHGATEAEPVGTRPRVTVTYQHPEHFTETRKSRPIVGSHDDDYLNRLKAYLKKRAAKILGPGQTLDIVITDIDRAGDYEPWHGPNYDRVRILRDIYPPRIDLNFKLLGADGRLLREGSRKLRDPGFLSTGAAGPGSTDTLRYEKRLLDRWLHKGVDGL